MSTNSTKLPASGAHPRTSTPRRSLRAKGPSEDEILGLVTSIARPMGDGSDPDAQFLADGAKSDVAATSAGAGADAAATKGASAQNENAKAPAAADSGELAQAIEAHPELRDAVEAAQQFRAVFPTPAAAQDAKAQLDELDAMFFSGTPADHAALAARIHELSPEAFRGLASAMKAHAAKMAGRNPEANAPGGAADTNVENGNSGASSIERADEINTPAQPHANVREPGTLTDAFRTTATDQTQAPISVSAQTSDSRRTAQLAFYHSTNAAVVQKIVGAIESQVNQLLPESISPGAKTRIVGEIYRDLDSTLRGNSQLGKQLRDAFAAAAKDGANPGGDARVHQQAIVALMTGRARQALPAIAKRVINEWTHSVVAGNRERLARHESAAKRVDIAGGGASDGVNRKPMSPRDVDYKRLSDSDILNL